MKEGLELLLAYGQEVEIFRIERAALHASANAKLELRDYDGMTPEEVKILYSCYDPYYMFSDQASTHRRGDALREMLAHRKDVDTSGRIVYHIPEPSEDVLRYVPDSNWESTGEVVMYVEWVESIGIQKDSDLIALKTLLKTRRVILEYLETLGPKTHNVALDSGVARYAYGNVAYLKLPTPVRLAADEFTAAILLLEPAYRLGLRDVLDIRISELKVVAKPKTEVRIDFPKSGVYLRNGYYICI